MLRTFSGRGEAGMHEHSAGPERAASGSVNSHRTTRYLSFVGRRARVWAIVCVLVSRRSLRGTSGGSNTDTDENMACI